MTDRPLHFIVPAVIDDPRRPSGGNVYDRVLSDTLAKSGWSVIEHARDIAGLLATLPDDTLVLADALVAIETPGVFTAHARRLRLVVLSHMSFGGDAEAAVLRAARVVVTTGEAARGVLVGRHLLEGTNVHVATPGVEIGELASTTCGGGNLLCVGVVAPHKGQDALVSALAGVRDRPWRCTFVGALDIDPRFVARLRDQANHLDIDSRISFTGPLTRDELENAYQATDLLISASHAESYGMAITEALAHGVPVLATDVGGVREALGSATDPRRPGRLVRPGDPGVLATALRDWLDDAALRAELRAAARDRRRSLGSWARTAQAVARSLNQTATRCEIPA